MNEKGKKTNWIISILINAGIAAAVLLLTHMSYETNDDFAISSRIVDGYSEVYFINYYLCFVLTKIQNLIPSLNAHVMMQLVLSFISFVCILKLVMDNCKEKIVVIAASAMILFFSIDQYSTIQFTKSAALMTTAGAMLLIDALIKSRNAFYYITGFLLFLVGSCLRIEGTVVPFGFAGIYAIAWMIDHRSGLKGFLVERRKAIISVLGILIIGAVALQVASLWANNRTPELKEYTAYNSYRTSIVDYSRLDYYEEQKTEYDKAGFDDFDIKLIRAWMFDYDGAASSENLAKIIQISDGAKKEGMTLKKASVEFLKETRKNIRKVTAMGAQIIVLMLLGIWLMVAGKWSSRLLVVLSALAASAMHIMLYFVERPAYRAFYVPDICAAMFMIYALSELGELPRWKKAPGIAVALIALALVFPVYKQSDDTFKSNQKRVMSNDFVEYLSNDKDTFYVVGTREKKSNPGYLIPWKAPDTSIDDNCMGTGSWGTKSPYIMDKLAAYGMTNPIKDLIDNDRARFIGNKNVKNLTAYLNKWYGKDGKKIYFEEVGKIDGLKVWAVKSR